MQEITVLGEKYTIEVLPEKEDSGLETSDGYCDFSTRNIIIRDMTDDTKRPISVIVAGRVLEKRLPVTVDTTAKTELEKAGIVFVVTEDPVF